MFGLNKNPVGEGIKNPPSDDSYPMVSVLFSRTNVVGVKALSLSILELIDKGQIRCNTDLKESYNVGKKLNVDDMGVMKKITLRIANHGEMKTSQTAAINLLKNMNKNKKFNLKSMAKQSNNSSVANKFEKDFREYVGAVKTENSFNGDVYRDIFENGKLTGKGKKLKKQWKNFRDYLKSEDLTHKYPPESGEENSMQVLYGACFDIEKDVLALRENNTPLTDFIDKDGYKLLNIIFNNALSNVSVKRKGDGIFYDINDKYTIPGGG